MRAAVPGPERLFRSGRSLDSQTQPFVAAVARSVADIRFDAAPTSI